ncbi:hypothetical protein BDAP_000953, partial [Binucleata daphniae]
KNIKKLLKDKKLYMLNNFMKDDVIETFNLADYMPDCITKYACNKEIFDKQTQAIRKLIDFGRINYKKFFRVLNEEIDYNEDDKEMLAKLVDTQMNDFLHKNINSLTLLFPKMQFFMEYYNKYQDDIVFFVDIKHVCMVYGMMHILETILKCTEHVVNDIKKINGKIIDCSNGNRIYKHYSINSLFISFCITKCEIEKMLLYILQPFLPADHFIDLANLFHIKLVCSLGIFKNFSNGIRFEKPSKTESAMLRMSTYCYIYFDTLETDDSGTQKNVTHIFFRHLMNVNVITNIYINLQQCLTQQDLLILNNCFSIYIRKNADKLSDYLKETYDRLVEIHNYMQSISPPDLTKKNDKKYLETIKTNSYNITIDIYRDEDFYLPNRPVTHHFYKKVSKRSLSIYTVFCYTLNYICDTILASEATFLMSYDIISDKNVIEKRIAEYMEIVENWNNTNYNSYKSIDTVISFKKPKFKLLHKAKNKKK